MEKRVTTSFEQTQKLGKEFASTLQGGDVLALFGDLGSGKTTFVQGLALGLGFNQRVVSPTFIIVKTYERKGNNTVENVHYLYHADLYRLEDGGNIDSIGLTEMMDQKDSITVIEWPEKLGEKLPKKAKKIFFKHVSKEEREITYT